MKTYGKIKDPDLGVIPFEDWPHLRELLDIFQNKREVIILKSRQIGISWLVAGYALWKALFFQAARILMLSQGEEEAADLLSKSKFYWSQLPDFLKYGIGKDQASLITFPRMHSEIRALPSTEKAGHGYSAALVIRDELEHHPYAEENFAAIGPAVDAGGSQIDLSTVNKMKLNTHFKTRYIQAKNGESGAYPVFLGAKTRISRLKGKSFEEWFAEIKRRYPPWMVEQEYPLKEEEALETLKTRKFFDLDALERIKRDLREPIKHDLTSKYGNMVRIYKLPVVGRRYCNFTDPSDGKEDPHAIIVKDITTGEWVALSHGKITADQCAMIHDDLVRFYNNAFNTHELNSRAGGIFSEKLKNLDTPNQCPFVNTNGKLDTKGKVGWWTGEKFKRDMLWGLEESVRLGQEIIYDKDCYEEMNQFMVPEGEDPQPPKGGHDDIIMAAGGLLQIQKYLPTGKQEVRSYPYRRDAW